MHWCYQIAKPKMTGFSLNKEMLIEDWEADSLCAQHLIYDPIKATNKEAHGI